MVASALLLIIPFFLSHLNPSTNYKDLIPFYVIYQYFLQINRFAWFFFVS